MDVPRIAGTQEGELAIRPLKFWENWIAVQHMFRNYPSGLDVAWDAEVNGILRPIYKRYLEIPLYMAVKNEGYGLRLGQQLVGLLYLQHPYLVTHINDVEIDSAYRGRGYSRHLLDFAETRARQLNKKYMTLAVTLTNKRAFNIYKQIGYLEQHDRFYQLTRRWWSEPDAAPIALAPITTQHYQREASQRRIGLTQLRKAQADSNLLRFFRVETEATIPEVSAVWLAHYLPQLPAGSKGSSFALTLGLSEVSSKNYCGHADLFDYGSWVRWRVFLDPTSWDKADLKALLELLISQVTNTNLITVAFGSAAMHERAKFATHELGLQERYSDRTLMIKVL